MINTINNNMDRVELFVNRITELYDQAPQVRIEDSILTCNFTYEGKLHHSHFPAKIQYQLETGELRLVWCQQNEYYRQGNLPTVVVTRGHQNADTIINAIKIITDGQSYPNMTQIWREINN